MSTQRMAFTVLLIVAFVVPGMAWAQPAAPQAQPVSPESGSFMSVDLPSETSRLFPHYELSEGMAEHAPDLVIAKVLEEGDQTDLRWLTTAFPEEDLRFWLLEHADRLLTRRSRSFWRLILDLPHSEEAPPGELLWPL